MPLARLRALNVRIIAMGLAAVLVGAAIGIGGYTFLYAKGSSYLSSDPAACANCHVMRSHVDDWTRSSHHAVAVCDDCHLPDDLVGKYLTQARDGHNHSTAFTTGRFKEPIRIKQASLDVVEDACRRCHGETVQMIDGPHGEGERISCVRCHSDVGH